MEDLIHSDETPDHIKRMRFVVLACLLLGFFIGMFTYAKLFSSDCDDTTEPVDESSAASLDEPQAGVLPIDFDEIEAEIVEDLKIYPDSTESIAKDEILELDGVDPDEDNVRANRFIKYDDLMVASRQGDREAQYKLAYAYYEVGEGHSYRTGFNWLKKSARSGYLPAVRDLALWYCQGIGTAADPIRSMAWHQLAARFGVAFNEHYHSLRTCNTTLDKSDLRKVQTVFDSHYSSVSRNPGW